MAETTIVKGFTEFEPWILGGKYYMACTVGGEFEDRKPSVVTVLKIGRGKKPDVQVGEYVGHASMDDLVGMVRDLHEYYNGCGIVIEVNGVAGEILQNNLIRSGCKNLYRWRNYRTGKVSDRPGWTTTARTKPLLLSNFCDWDRKGLIVINSKQPEVTERANQIALFCAHDMEEKPEGKHERRREKINRNGRVLPVG